ncbi:nuclear-pore anchor-like [Callorhinchus milii]|uniref:nuclear-pore anchor-like n=1 Tax=Callorhinchus milii TaxID=7868 RepID=UPI001C3FB7A7|nr:nuclear-pore anchor-like [Callorhinchus milii]
MDWVLIILASVTAVLNLRAKRRKKQDTLGSWTLCETFIPSNCKGTNTEPQQDNKVGEIRRKKRDLEGVQMVNRAVAAVVTIEDASTLTHDEIPLINPERLKQKETDLFSCDTVWVDLENARRDYHKLERIDKDFETALDQIYSDISEAQLKLLEKEIMNLQCENVSRLSRTKAQYDIGDDKISSVKEAGLEELRKIFFEAGFGKSYWESRTRIELKKKDFIQMDFNYALKTAKTSIEKKKKRENIYQINDKASPLKENAKKKLDAKNHIKQECDATSDFEKLVLERDEAEKNLRKAEAVMIFRQEGALKLFLTQKEEIEMEEILKETKINQLRKTLEEEEFEMCKKINKLDIENEKEIQNKLKEEKKKYMETLKNTELHKNQEGRKYLEESLKLKVTELNKCQETLNQAEEILRNRETELRKHNEARLYAEQLMEDLRIDLKRCQLSLKKRDEAVPALQKELSDCKNSLETSELKDCNATLKITEDEVNVLKNDIVTFKESMATTELLRYQEDLRNKESTLEAKNKELKLLQLAHSKAEITRRTASMKDSEQLLNTKHKELIDCQQKLKQSELNKIKEALKITEIQKFKVALKSTDELLTEKNKDLNRMNEDRAKLALKDFRTSLNKKELKNCQQLLKQKEKKLQDTKKELQNSKELLSSTELQNSKELLGSTELQNSNELLSSTDLQPREKDTVRNLLQKDADIENMKVKLRVAQGHFEEARPKRDLVFAESETELNICREAIKLKDDTIKEKNRKLSYLRNKVRELEIQYSEKAEEITNLKDLLAKKDLNICQMNLQADSAGRSFAEGEVLEIKKTLLESGSELWDHEIEFNSCKQNLQYQELKGKCLSDVQIDLDKEHEIVALKLSLKNTELMECQKHLKLKEAEYLRQDAEKEPKEPLDKDPTESTDEDPTGSTDKDPTESTDKEPTGSTDKDPTGSTDKDPTGSTDKDPTGSTDKDPTGSTDKDPTGSTDKDPTGSTDKDPTGSTDKDPTGSTDKDPTGSTVKDPTGYEAAEKDTSETTGKDSTTADHRTCLKNLAEAQKQLMTKDTEIKRLEGIIETTEKGSTTSEKQLKTKDTEIKRLEGIIDIKHLEGIIETTGKGSTTADHRTCLKNLAEAQKQLKTKDTEIKRLEGIIETTGKGSTTADHRTCLKNLAEAQKQLKTKDTEIKRLQVIIEKQLMEKDAEILQLKGDDIGHDICKQELETANLAKGERVVEISVSQREKADAVNEKVNELKKQQKMLENLDDAVFVSPADLGIVRTKFIKAEETILLKTAENLRLEKLLKETEELLEQKQAGDLVQQTNMELNTCKQQLNDAENKLYAVQKELARRIQIAENDIVIQQSMTSLLEKDIANYKLKDELASTKSKLRQTLKEIEEHNKAKLFSKSTDHPKKFPDQKLMREKRQNTENLALRRMLESVDEQNKMDTETDVLIQQSMKKIIQKDNEIGQLKQIIESKEKELALKTAESKLVQAEKGSKLAGIPIGWNMLNVKKALVKLDGESSDPRFLVSVDGSFAAWAAGVRASREEGGRKGGGRVQGHGTWSVWGTEPLGHGRHRWEVWVNEGTVWTVGVAKRPLALTKFGRAGKEEGYWAVMLWNLMEAEGREMEDEARHKLVGGWNGQPRSLGTSNLLLHHATRLGIALDSESGTLHFYNPSDMSAAPMASLTPHFTGPVYPLFRLWVGTASNATISIV